MLYDCFDRIPIQGGSDLYVNQTTVKIRGSGPTNPGPQNTFLGGLQNVIKYYVTAQSIYKFPSNSIQIFFSVMF